MKTRRLFQNIIVLICVLLFNGGSAQQKADLIIYNTTIYKVDAAFGKAEALAVKDGKILATGTSKEIQKRFRAKKKINLQGKFVYPGFIDAHAHFYGYGSALQVVDLRGTASWEDILNRLKNWAKDNPSGWLIGRGWDQNDWASKDFPTKKELDRLFPDRPVYLTRIDGHAAVVNQKALDLAGFTVNTRIAGGDLLQANGELTGVLIDNAKDQLAALMPAPNREMLRKMLLDAQKNTFAAGLTTIIDAGLDHEIVDEISNFQQEGPLKIRLNVMLSDSRKNVDYLIKKGIIKTPRLQVNSFKLYGDGALGSRGACLLEDYHDQPGHRGFLLSDTAHFKEMAKILYKHNFQMNTHAIGDSANRVLLKLYGEVLKGKNDRRWRIEHAQVMDPQDFSLFSKYSIVPSVQPTHATSDMYWAGDRLGNRRLKSSYAYLELLQQNGWLALGTDFPIENIHPLGTFYAAVVRKDAKGWPENGFQPENALSREQALRGITIWAARGSFLENEVGSIEVGKYADLVVLNQDLMGAEEKQLLKTKVLQTWVNGEQVFKAK